MWHAMERSRVPALDSRPRSALQALRSCSSIGGRQGTRTQSTSPRSFSTALAKLKLRPPCSGQGQGSVQQGTQGGVVVQSSLKQKQVVTQQGSTWSFSWPISDTDHFCTLALHATAPQQWGRLPYTLLSLKTKEQGGASGVYQSSIVTPCKTTFPEETFLLRTLFRFSPGGGQAPPCLPSLSTRSASRSLAKFNIGAANMRLGYYLGQWGDAVPAASGRTCVFPEGPEGPTRR
jgi:hypothetical protein